MPAFDDVAEFVREWTRFRRITDVTTLQSDIGLYGDDIDVFLADYAKRFGVDMAGFLWYFHTGEDGTNIGALFFSPPNARVKEIPITVGMLHEFAQQGRWAVEYPEHELPRSRPDILVNQIFALVVIGFLLIMWIRSCTS